MWWWSSLFSGLPHFLLLLFFSFQYMEVKERHKMGKAWEHLSHDVIWSGRRVRWGGGGGGGGASILDFMNVQGQSAQWWSLVHYFNVNPPPPPPPPTFTLCPPDVIHMISVPMPSHSSAFMYYTERKQEKQNTGEAWERGQGWWCVYVCTAPCSGGCNSEEWWRYLHRSRDVCV